MEAADDKEQAVRPFEDVQRVQALLETRLDRSEIAQRPQAGGQVCALPLHLLRSSTAVVPDVPPP